MMDRAGQLLIRCELPRLIGETVGMMEPHEPAPERAHLTGLGLGKLALVLHRRGGLVVFPLRLRLRLPELPARLLRLLLAAAEQRIEELLPVAHDEPQRVASPVVLRQLFEKGRLHGIRLRLFNRVGGLQFRQPRPRRV
jgi:hypothetical protein